MVGESSQARGTGGTVVGGQGGGVNGGGVGINCNSRNSRASGIVDSVAVQPDEGSYNVVWQ